MLTRCVAALAVLAGAVAGCAQGPVTVDGVTVSTRSCESLFRQLDIVENWEGLDFDDDDMAVPRNVQPIAGWLRNGDCITYSRDLAGMSAALADPSVPRGDGGRSPSGALVHAGIVTSIRDDARSLDYFGALGYPAYSLGSAGLGRRVYVGPVATEAEVAAVFDAARRAGFRYPYVKRYGRSFFGGIVQSR